MCAFVSVERRAIHPKAIEHRSEDAECPNVPYECSPKALGKGALVLLMGLGRMMEALHRGNINTVIFLRHGIRPEPTVA